jgi:multidrug efflux pump subunit AcrB
MMLQFLTQRPVAVLMSFLGLAILGAAAGQLLPVSLLPAADIPRISVHLSYPQAPAQQLEQIAVRPLRHQLLQTGGLRDIRSTARNESALIELSFAFGTDMRLALVEVNEKIDQLAAALPRDMERPRAVKANVADIPVFYLSFRSAPQHDGAGAVPLLELSDLARQVLKRRIEQLPQVAFADLSGQSRAEVALIPDQAKLRALNLSPQRLMQIIGDYELEPGVILVKDGQYEYNLRLDIAPRQVAELERLYFRHGQRLLQLKDVAQVRLREAAPRGYYWIDGEEGLVFAVYKQADARLFELQREMQALLASFAADYPSLEFQLTNDQTALLRVSIANLLSSLGYGCLFAFLVLFAFLRGWRIPLLIGLAIPLALVIALLGFYAAGLSVNTISLAGLLLGVGLMIDNSIIILDNIQQYRARGSAVAEACVQGPNEVIRPLISSGLTTVSVFVPLLFLSGLAGMLFYDQALSIAIALASSLLTAYFLLPTLVRQVVWRRHHPPPQSTDRLLALYGRSAHWADRRPGVTGLTAGLLLVVGGFALACLPQQSFPEFSRPGIQLDIDWNEPISLEENARRTRQLVEGFEPIGLSSAFIGEQQFLLEAEARQANTSRLLLFKDSLAETLPHWPRLRWADAEADASDWRQALQERYPKAIIQEQPIRSLFDELFSSGLPPLTIHLHPAGASEPLDVKQIEWLTGYLRQVGIAHVLPPAEEQLFIAIDAEAALRYGVARAAIIAKLQALFGQLGLGRLQQGNEPLPIVWAGESGDFQALLETATVLNEEGAAVPLKYFLRSSRQQRLKAITAIKTEASLDVVLPVYAPQWLSGIQAQIRQQPAWRASFSGQALEREGQFRELALALALALAMLYLILAAQFESLLQPFIVLLTVPLGMAGAFIALWWSGQSLNLVSLTGLVVMSGIVVNDAILKVDMMNRLCRSGSSLAQATHLAGQRRLRPILMTSATTILALTPVLSGGGLGAELQRPLAYAVIGGLAAGTLASLYFVPLLYRVWWRLVR